MTFTKGQSGNPAGRPKGSKHFTTKVREALLKLSEDGEATYETQLVKAILKKAIVDGDSASQRLIWNYLDGMPTQKVDTELHGKITTMTKELSDDELEEILNS